jgi:hypothetical protein
VGNQNSSTLNCFAFDLNSGEMVQVDMVHQPSPNFVFALPDDAAGNRDF